MKRLLSTVAMIAVGSSCGAPIPDHTHCVRDGGATSADPNFCDRDDSGLISIGVSVTEGSTGTSDAPIPYSSSAVTFTVRIVAQGEDLNTPLSTFNGFVALSVAPGAISTIESVDGTVVVGRNVQLASGVGTVRISFSRAYGVTRISAEDNGYIPVDPELRTPQCADGQDNDHDLRTDYPADYGCAAPNDDSETGGSYALGTSVPIYFGSPSIYDVQGGGATSPLTNQRVSVDTGTLIVTRISVSGLWVTDIADRSCPNPAAPNDPTQNTPCYNSIFAFNFSLPAGVRPCDRLSEIQGSVSEFASSTQLDQPSWLLNPEGEWIDEAHSGACQIPDAIELPPVDLANAQTLLEPFESSIVRVHGILWPTIVGSGHACTGGTCTLAPGSSNCDNNQDGVINFSDPVEAACSNDCSSRVGCSEWTNWQRYGQVQVDFVSGQPGGVVRLAIAPKDALPDFDPAHPPVTQATGAVITGTLNQAGPTYIIEPRCSDDVVLMGDSLPPNQTCVLPRTISEGP